MDGVCVRKGIIPEPGWGWGLSVDVRKGSPGGTDGSAEAGVHLRRVGHLGGPSATLPVIKAPSKPTRRAQAAQISTRVSSDPVI